MVPKSIWNVQTFPSYESIKQMSNSWDVKSNFSLITLFDFYVIIFLLYFIANLILYRIIIKPNQKIQIFLFYKVGT